MNHMQPPGNHLLEDFDDFFEQSLCGFLVTDPQGIILRGNTTVARWTGYAINELPGKRFSDLLSIGSKIYYETHLRPLLKMQHFFDEVVLELSTADTQKFRVLVNAFERSDSDGNTLFIRYTILKASDRLSYEQNLQQTIKKVEKDFTEQKEIVLMREQLIAVLGHDLRNPLSSIKVATDLLLQFPLNAEEVKLLSIVKRSAFRMAELINNIMDFARTRLGDGILLACKPVPLTPVLQHVVGELHLSFPKKDILTEFDIDEPVDCDADRIAQLLSNLLANAVTHGFDDTPIHIYASNKKGRFELSVSNKGKQIPENFLKKLFAPFTRESDRPSQNGLGLGLFISAEIAKAHGGTLTCTSIDDETRFTFSMPYEVKTPAAIS